jgi:diacylglycerol kinase (ATP)
MNHHTSPTGAPRTATRFSWRSRLRSFSHAFNGLALMLQTQHNAWLHLLASLMVAATAWLLGVSASDWRWLLTAMTLVWAAEAMNTAIEFVCDVVSPQYSYAVKSAKDIAAAAVLITAAGAAAIGLLTLWPHLVAHAAHLR